MHIQHVKQRHWVGCELSNVDPHLDLKLNLISNEMLEKKLEAFIERSLDTVSLLLNNCFSETFVFSWKNEVQISKIKLEMWITP